MRKIKNTLDIIAQEKGIHLGHADLQTKQQEDDKNITCVVIKNNTQRSSLKYYKHEIKNTSRTQSAAHI